MNIPTVRVRRIGDHVVVLELSDPATRNALSATLRDELTRALQRTSEDSTVRSIVLTGDGDTFCSGMDLAEMAADPVQTTAALQPLCDVIQDTPQPVVAAIDGHCLGGGLQLALSCDLRVAGETARFGVPATRVGIVYPPAAVRRLVAVAGLSRATEMLLTAHTIDGLQAARDGIVHRVVIASPMEAAVEVAEELALRSPFSIGASKRLLNRTTSGDDDLSALDDAVSGLRNPDLLVGLAAARKRVRPTFPPLDRDLLAPLPLTTTLTDRPERR